MAELADAERKRLHVPELTGAAVRRGEGGAGSSPASVSRNRRAHLICPSGGIGRHTAFRSQRLTAMGVQVPPRTPNSSEWWNRQTHQSQKLTVNSHEGSSPSSDTNFVTAPVSCVYAQTQVKP